jgi:hypothetical protein
VLHSCQPTKWRFLNRFQRLYLPFSFCFSLSLLKLSSKKNQKKQKRCSAVLARVAARCRPLPRVTAHLANTAAASCNPLPASPQQRATTLYRPRPSSELQRSAGLAAALCCQELQCSVATRHRSNSD